MSAARNPLHKVLKALSTKERLALYLSLAIFLSSFIVYAMLTVKNNTYLIPKDGGSYREGIVGQPAFVNPVIPITETDRVISRLVFASLADMAEAIKRSDDGRVWNVRLEEGIIWHDGEKLTADDIIFTMDVIRNPESRSPLRGSFEGVDIRRVSELEVEFTLQNTYAFFEEDHLENLRPMPRHLFADIPVTNYKLSPYGLAPVGSGPYKVTSHDKDARAFVENISLEANEDYLRGRPHITNFTFNFYKKESELIGAYNLGQIDGFGISTYEPIDERAIIIRHTPHLLNSSRYYAVFINQSLAPEDLGAKGVRRALSGSVNRAEIIEDLFGGFATPFFGPTNLSQAPQAQFDPEILDGLILNLVVPDEPFLVKTGEELKKDWEPLGAQVNLINRSSRDIQEDVLRDTNYELLLFGNIVKDSNDLFAFWHSSKRFFPDQNLALYQDEVTDGLLEDYRSTFDPASRSDLLSRISERITSDIPAIFLYSPSYVYITTPSLGGFDDSKTINTSDDRFEDVTNWFVRSSRSFTNPVDMGVQ